MGPPKKGRVLQVLDANYSETVHEFTDLFLRRVLGGYDVSVDRISRADDVSGDAPLIVICNNYFRLGTDINAAMEGVPAGQAQDRMVIVMHVTQPQVQPTIMPTDTLSSQYHELGYLVDFTYTHEDKIYKCDMNKTGDEKVDNFLQQHFKRRFAFYYRKQHFKRRFAFYYRKQHFKRRFAFYYRKHEPLSFCLAAVEVVLIAVVIAWFYTHLSFITRMDSEKATL